MGLRIDDGETMSNQEGRNRFYVETSDLAECDDCNSAHHLCYRDNVCDEGIRV